jgi:hypothetical protein
MALPESPSSISLNEIHIEAGGTSGTTASINDADIRALIGKGDGVTMSFNEWYGASGGWSTTVTVGIISSKFVTTTGFTSGDSGFSAAMGSVSDSTVDTYGGAALWDLFDFNGITLFLTIQGTRANSGWTKITVDGVDFNRADATFAQQSGYTRWTWPNSNNAFGTTVGAQIVCTIS